MNCIQQAKASVIAKASTTEFDNMTGEQFGEWIDRLPQPEFFALIRLTDEYRRTGGPIASQPPPTSIPRFMPPSEDDWIVYTGEGETPLPDDVLCYVLFPDGGEEGPNRADAFLWGGEGLAEILAYAPARSLS